MGVEFLGLLVLGIGFLSLQGARIEIGVLGIANEEDGLNLQQPCETL
jgi:hypothetical protein